MTATHVEAHPRTQASPAPVACLGVTMVLFGSAFPSSKVVVDEMPHQLAAAIRFGIGAVVLVVLVAVRRVHAREAIEPRRDRRPAALSFMARAAAAGLLGVFAYNLMFFWALSLAPAADGSVLVPVLAPVLTAAGFILTGRERPVPFRVAGLLAGATGAVLFITGIDATASETRLLGDLLFVAGAACWAGYTVLSKRVLVGMDALVATTCATAAGAAALTAVAMPSAVHVDWSAISTSAWTNLVYLGIGPSAAAYLTYSIALRTVSPTTATLAMFAVPLVGVAGSLAFLGETFTWLQILGAAILLIGAIVAVTARSPAPGPRVVE